MIRAIVTDIEGTTTDIDFVHKVLFPYSDTHLDSYVTTHQNDPEVQLAIQDSLMTAREESLLTPGHQPMIDALTLWHRWIKEDRKHPTLKWLQGKIWNAGYASKAFTSHIYADVPAALKAWHDQSVTLAVYSSGSVEAQRLLFGHTAFGDLNPLFSANFDTKIGHKRESPSYRAIAEALRLPPDAICFLSDIKEELDAARAIGMHGFQLVRDARVAVGDHPTATDFTSVAESLPTL